MSEPRRFRVLFVCIGNSCRSQMAEAFARHRYPELFAAMSAGVMPASIVQPETIEVMSEIGLPIEDQKPKPIREVDWKSADIVINMSGTGIFHMLPGYEGGNLIWSVEDPMGYSIRKHRRIRDQVGKLVDDLAVMVRRQQDT